MKPETIARAQALLPATREELAQRLGLKPGCGQRVAKHMLREGYAREWGDKMTSRGTLTAVLHAAEKVPS